MDAVLRPVSWNGATPRILVVDDDRRIGNLLRRALTAEGYAVEVVANGVDGIRSVQERPPDLVILDVMMPGLDGVEVCRRVRAISSLPILMLTAKDEVRDRIVGLDAGADDYVVKPFDLDELLARVRAQLRRRSHQQEDRLISFADVSADTSARIVRRGARVLDLTAKEYDLLLLFLRHPNQVLTRQVILERVWGYDFGGETNVLDVYVGYLRAKLEAKGEPRLLQTIRGVGYVLRESR